MGAGALAAAPLALLEVVDRDGLVRQAWRIERWPVSIGRALDNDRRPQRPARRRPPRDARPASTAASGAPARSSSAPARRGTASASAASASPAATATRDRRQRPRPRPAHRPRPAAPAPAGPRARARAGDDAGRRRRAALAADARARRSPSSPSSSPTPGSTPIPTALARAAGAHRADDDRRRRDLVRPVGAAVEDLHAAEPLRLARARLRDRQPGARSTLAVLPPLLAFAFSWPWVTDFSFVAVYATVAAAIYFHLLAVEPARERPDARRRRDRLRRRRRADALVQRAAHRPARRGAVHEPPVPAAAARSPSRSRSTGFVEGLAPMQAILDRKAKERSRAATATREEATMKNDDRAATAAPCSSPAAAAASARRPRCRLAAARLGRRRQLRARPSRRRRGRRGDRRRRRAGARAFQADVADDAEVRAMFAAIDARRCRRSAGLVNNAGVVDVAARVDAMSVERLQRMFAINVFGSFYCAREAIRRMTTSRRGRPRRARGRRDRQRVVGGGDARRPGAVRRLRRRQGRRSTTFTIGLAKELAGRRHPRQRGPARHHRHRDPRLRRPPDRVRADRAAGADAARRHAPTRSARRSSGCCPTRSSYTTGSIVDVTAADAEPAAIVGERVEQRRSAALLLAPRCAMPEVGLEREARLGVDRVPHRSRRHARLQVAELGDQRRRLAGELLGGDGDEDAQLDLADHRPEVGPLARPRAPATPGPRACGRRRARPAGARGRPGAARR